MYSVVLANDMKDHFKNAFVGQEAVRKKLSYYLEIYYQTSIFRNVLLLSARGEGKTAFARKIGEKLNKNYVEVNGATITSVDDFFDTIFVPKCLNRPVTLFIDEIHALKRKTVEFLLSVLAPNANHRNIVSIQGGSVTVDFRQFTFLAASTESQSIFPALKSRLENIMLSKYSKEEIKAIIQLHSRHIDIEPDALDYLLDYCKLNARAAFDMAIEIINYTQNIKRSTLLDLEGAQELIEIRDLYQYGLSRLEVEILEYVADNGASSLTKLAAQSGLTTQAQRNLELELLSHNLLEINNGRRITLKGRKYLTENQKR